MANGLKRKRPSSSENSNIVVAQEPLLIEAHPSDHGLGTLLNPPPSSESGVTLAINEEYAKRFEHNKKREELHRLQDKYGISTSIAELHSTNLNLSSDESSDSEDEDDDGVLASTAVDAQIQQALEAIRKKDPRVYDSNTNFFSDEDSPRDIVARTKTAKPIYLSEYHRRNLLQGDDEPLESKSLNPKTFADEQIDLKRSVISGIQDAASLGIEGDHNTEDSTLLIAKEHLKHPRESNDHHDDALAEVDIRLADNDPEEFLSKYMTTRAWVPTNNTKYEAFESDDDEHDQAAEDFEEAYNLRFEDPSKSNEKLTSHARDIVAKHSVRKPTLSARQRAREARKNEEIAARQLRKEEKARLRNLKVEALHQKLQRIKEAAGISDEQLRAEDWSTFLDEGWDDDKWELEMQKRFGPRYYEEGEGPRAPDGHTGKARLRKPKWEDDIDISDLIPASRSHTESPLMLHESHGSEHGPSPESKTLQGQKRKRKRDIRLERQKIEQVIDEQMDVDDVKSRIGKGDQGSFRYRETSPVSFGLTARDILMASDRQLNQHAGLKKYAVFRDTDKKRKDNKILSKKSRLRKWRMETFGSDAEPKESIAELFEPARGQNGHYQTNAKSVEETVGRGEARRRKRRAKESKI